MGTRAFASRRRRDNAQRAHACASRQRDEWRARAAKLEGELAEARRLSGYRQHVLGGGRLEELPVGPEELARIAVRHRVSIPGPPGDARRSVPRQLCC